MLTRKQFELLTFINRRLTESGVSPSFDEMKEALGLRSKSGIHRLITGLEERGFIRRLPHRARALEVLRLPDQVSAKDTSKQGDKQTGETTGRRFTPNVIEGHFAGPLAGAATGQDLRAVPLPLYGKIAAGTPIEALHDETAAIDVPLSLLGTGEHYALEIEGDSMIDAGIQDGDTVIIQRCDTAENGTIVVALVDEQEATLKRLRRKGGSIALEPANAAYETRIFGPERVKVQGRLVGLLRRY
ncbi:transcriptional repressor LexA [Oceanibaculum nanhaiense]|uniref:transcriptional repressor LexA n=1 Tax=Oceanibaculum nanhaiense TaxID=1909734 RepID=UPI000A38DD92|nr:transcriptional repressor LexA [Oceanibaculum nanhaiense]MBC7135502.1 transcriptional repressor LexA [Oceanibaculum nanhaiense]